MRRRRFSGRSSSFGFNFAPMVDVVLLLLIFFMAATTLGRQVRGLPVELPASDAADQHLQQLEVTVDRNGQIALGEAAHLTLGQLQRRLQAALPKGGAVTLRADRRVSHGQVVAVMDVIKRAGATRLDIAAFGNDR